MKPILQGLLHSLLMIVGILLLVYALSTFSKPVQAQWCNDPVMCTMSVTAYGCRGGCFSDDSPAMAEIAVITKMGFA